MASSLNFILFVVEQLGSMDNVTYKKMFGDYMIYVNAKPVFLICDDIVYVKMLDCIADIMDNAEVAEPPYRGAKPHYILDVDDRELTIQAATRLEKVTAIPKPKKKKM